MLTFHLTMGNQTGISYKGDFSCRDSARTYVMYYGTLTYSTYAQVDFHDTARSAAEKICDLMRAVPAYADTRIDVVDVPASFDKMNVGLKFSGPEMFHAFYWGTLFLRAACITHREWNTLAQLVQYMPPGVACDYGDKVAHIKSWRAFMNNNAPTSEAMRRFTTGPIDVSRYTTK